MAIKFLLYNDYYIKVIFSFLLLFILNTASADIFNNNAFLNGKGIELGIGPDGAFGSDIVAPSGFYKGKFLGFISDSQFDGFENGYDGDFFFPGSPEEGWGVSINGISYNNNNNIQSPQIKGVNLESGQFSDFFDEHNYSQSVKWTGQVENLKIEKKYKIYEMGNSIWIEVKLTNLSQNDINNVYYIRTLDPDNNYSNIYNPTGTYETTNTIIKQGKDHGYSLVSATQSDGSSLSLMGFSSQSRVSLGGYLIRNPLDLYEENSGMIFAGTRTADIPISLVFNLGTIQPGSDVSFQYAYNLSLMDLFNLETEKLSYQNNRQYLVGKEPIIIFPVVASNLESNKLVNELIVDIKSPRKGDQLLVSSLPDGVSIDERRTVDDYIVIRGSATIETYLSILKQIKFNNNLTDLSLDELSLDNRLITAYILNHNFSASNQLESTVSVTMPVTINTPIMGDNKVSLEESSSVYLQGSSAPNSTVKVSLLDVKNNQVERIVDSLISGEWEVTLLEKEWLSLEDGSISVLLEAIDANGLKTETNHSFVKDTQVLPLLFSATENPLDDKNISQTEIAPFLLSGTAEINSMLTIEVKDSAEKRLVFDVPVDDKGKWSVSTDELADLADGMLTFKMIKQDELGNKGEELYLVTKDLTTTLFLNADIRDDIINSQNQNKLPLSGKGEPNATIKVIFKGVDDAVVKVETIVDEKGEWSFMPNNIDVSSLPEGAVTLTITGVDSAGNSKTINYPRPLLKDSKVESSAILSPGSNGIVNFEEPEIKGTAEPQATIIITSNEEVICTTKSDESSHWQCLLPAMEPDNSRQIVVTVRDQYNNIEQIPLSITAGKFSDVQVIKTVLKGSGGMEKDFLLLLVLLMLLLTFVQRKEQ